MQGELVMAKTPEESTPEKVPVSRREFLNLAWLASLGFLTVSLGGVTFLFAMPRFKEGEFGGVVPVGTATELPATDAPPENLPKVKLWLSNTDQGVVALYKVCTHLGCLYNWNNQEDKFICPCHGSQFQKDGIYIAGPAPRNLDRFAMQAVDSTTGEILVESSDGTPMPLPDDPNAVIQVDTGKRIKGQPHA
jgi:cytochrome b6-f complex iron-sulfur subunit